MAFGTLAAAKQAVLLGIKGIAFSTLRVKRNPILKRLNHLLKRLFRCYSKTINCRFIMWSAAKPTGVRWTRQSVRLYDGKVVPGIDPMGRKHYWFTVVPLEPAEEGTDRWATEQGFVSITPLRLDLTNEEELNKRLTQQPVSWCELWVVCCQWWVVNL